LLDVAVKGVVHHEMPRMGSDRRTTSDIVSTPMGPDAAITFRFSAWLEQRLVHLGGRANGETIINLPRPSENFVGGGGRGPHIRRLTPAGRGKELPTGRTGLKASGKSRP